MTTRKTTHDALPQSDASSPQPATGEYVPVRAQRRALLATARGPVLALLPAVLALLLALLVLAQPWQARVDVGERFDRPYLEQFHRAEFNAEQQITFRWSQPTARLTLPGAGHLAALHLRVYSDRQILLRLESGSGEQTIRLRPGWQTISLLPRPAPWSGDVQVHLAVAAQVSADDPRERGMVLDWIALEGRGGTPPWGQALLVGLSVWLATLLAGRALRRQWAGIFTGLALTAALVAVLALNQGSERLLLTAYTGRLALVLAAGGGLMLACEGLLGWLDRRGIVPFGRGTRRALAAVALLAFLLRFGGLAYPLNYNSDLPLILGRTWMVREGQLLDLFLPNPALTPVQWGEDFTIPRSPFYYILTTPVTLLPYEGTGDKLGMMAFSSAVDALAVLLVAVLARWASGSGRAAVLAAFLAGMLPVGLMFLVSWGILPTLLGQFLSLLVLVLWLHLRPRLREWRAFVLLTGGLTLAFISYPTALLFLGTTGLLLLLALALQRDPATLPTLGAALAALALSFGLFYGWHVPSMVTETLPRLLGDASGGQLASGAGLSLQRTWDGLWLQLADKYGGLVLLLAGTGALLLATAHLDTRARYTRLVVVAWVGAFVPLALADEYVVTFILKHILHILPMLALLGGLLLGRLWRYPAGRAVALVVLAWVLWQAAVLEVDVIVNAFVQLK